MSLIDVIRELGWKLPSHPEALEEQEFDPHTGEGKVFLYETDACNFEVLVDGEWYKVDAMHPYHRLYEGTDVPVTVIQRVSKVMNSLYDPEKETILWDEAIDPSPYILDALRTEFDDARFVNMTIVPGAIY